MVVAHRNEGIAPLDTQLKAKYPGIEIGWIGDPAHKLRKSAHNPNLAGRVNAIDPMIGKHFTWADAVWLTATLAFHHDIRINNIIFNRRIWDDAVEDWRDYDGDDPHTGHVHIEVHDSAFTNSKPWNLTGQAQKEWNMVNSLNGYALPNLMKGDDDSKMAGWNFVSRAQAMLKWLVASDLVVDGIYGNATASAVRELNSSSNGNTLGMIEWAQLYGLTKVATK